MTPDTWQRVRAEYEAGLDESVEVRAARLDALRAADRADLADEVAGLWTAEAAAGGFLENGPGAEPDPFAGTLVGPYRLLHRLGTGGMGAVYLAARADGEYRRRVALKLLKPGMDSEEILRRFRVERQILAALDHPHIGRLLDGGTTEAGRPYFVMEAVFGEPIDAWCRARPFCERLRLFATVCRTVQFAHQNLVVHRDLKPSNVLVTTEGVPKLLDFGIAKLLNPELGGPTLVATAPVAGPHTPDYASPEQLHGERVTTATDVFSLGLLLAELSTGERPRRDANGLATGAPPPGDLGAIVAKALRPAPADRYPSAAALAEDVERFLDGHPVRARKGTAAYRTRLFLRRHKVGVAMAATALVAILGFGVAMAVLAARLAEERRAAEVIASFLTDLFKVADPFRDQEGVADPTARELLAVGAERARSELAERPALKARLLRTIGESYLNLGQLDLAQTMLEEALAFSEAHFPEDDLALAASLNQLAGLLDERNQRPRAERLYLRSLEIRRQRLGGEHLEVAASLNNLGVLYQNEGRYEEAARAHEESIRIRRGASAMPTLELAAALGNLAGVSLELGHEQAAEARFREALEVVRALGKEGSGWDASLTLNLGTTLLRGGNCAAALPWVEKARGIFERIAPDTSYVADARESQGRILTCLGRLDAAAELHASALDLRRGIFGPDHPALAKSFQNLAETALAAGRLAEAEARAREALALRRRVLPPDHPDTFDALAVLGAVLAKQGAAEAGRVLEEVVAGREASLGPDHPKTRKARTALAGLARRPV